MFNLKKGGLIVAQMGLTLLNYILWAVVLKPLGIAETANAVLLAAGDPAASKGVHAGYVAAKVIVYLATTGTFLALLKKNDAYKNVSLGGGVLGCTAVAFAVDFLNMTIVPAFPFYMLATLLLLISKEVEEKKATA